MRRTVRYLLAVMGDTSGSLLPMAAVGMLLAAILVGSAIDVSRTYKVQSHLQSACDAAVLAGRRMETTNGFDDASKAAATMYFNANFDEPAADLANDLSVNFGSEENGATVTGTASVSVKTLVMRLFGFDAIPVSANCASSMGIGNADVMMVLDTTGSMNDTLSGSTTRIQALRQSMKNFYTTLQKATAGSNARVRYGFVPYSSTVNVGRLLYAKNPNYLVNSRDYQSRIMETSTSTSTSGTSSSYGGIYSYTYYSSSYSCNSNLPKDGNYENDGSPSNSTSYDANPNSLTYGNYTTYSVQDQKRTSYYCSRSNGRYYIYKSNDSVSVTTTTYHQFHYLPISYDTSVYKTFSPVTSPKETFGDFGNSVTSTWAGCIEERQTQAVGSFSYNTTTGISPSSALDMDLDSAPDVHNDNTKWAPMWPEVAFQRMNYYGSYTQSDSYYGRSVIPIGYTACPAAARNFSVMTQSAFNSYADSLVAQGGTYLDIGMIWGGRLSSRTGIFADNVNDPPSNGGEVSRHLIFMTDGFMQPTNTMQEAWGMEYWDKRVTGDGSSSQDAARHTSRFLAACEAIKAKGIRIWVIAFTSNLSDDLKTCASDDSSYTANSSGELNNAFQEIAKNVGELRIVQ